MERFWTKIKTTLGFQPPVSSEPRPSEPDESPVPEEARPPEVEKMSAPTPLHIPEPPIFVQMEQRILNAERYAFGGRSLRLMGTPPMPCSSCGILNANRYRWVTFKTGILNADRFSWQGPHNRVLNGARYSWKIIEI